MFESINQSLAKSTLLSMGLRISIVVVITALLSYWHIVDNLESQTVGELKQYIVERAQKESAIFQLAEDNHRVFKQAFLSLWPTRQHTNPDQRFQQLFEQKADGSTHLIDAAFTGMARPHQAKNDYVGESQWISGFVDKHAPIALPVFKNKLLLAYDLVDRFGEGWSNRFANTYAALPKGANIVYWPHLNWASTASPDLDIANEEWVSIANKVNNPSRKPVWTGLYYDQTADEWMVSCETPIDDADGEHLINIGHDILLNHLFQRVFDDHLAGAYNFIVRHDGRLIAHPLHTKALKETSGLLLVDDLPNSDVLSQYNNIIETIQKNKNGDKTFIIDHQGSDAFIAFDHIDGPDWIFVTVYPKTLLSNPVKKTVLFILYVGLLALLIELAMLYRVLSHKVLRPMQQFKTASDMISKGQYKLHDVLASTKARQDEVGEMAQAMTFMSDRIQNQTSEMEVQIVERTQQLEDAKEFAEHQARTDPLTELLNRRAFFEIGNYAFENAKRHHHPLSIIAIDVDKFKNVNDTYGHSGGDIILKELSTYLSKFVRQTDACARIGGEEFAILLPNTDLNGAMNVAEQIRETVEALNVQVDDHVVNFTISCGVANITMSIKRLEDILQAADLALYQAKDSGRNRVIASNND